VAKIQKLHEQVRDKIEKSNPPYQAQANKHWKRKLFQPGDLIWIHLRKDRFSTRRKTKLMPRAEGPFEIIKRLNDNAYKVDLPGDYGVSATFNVADLSPYFDGNYLEDLRANSSSQWENDGGPSLHASTSPTKSKGMLMESIFQVLEMSTDRAHHGQAVASPMGVFHSGLKASNLPSFVLLVC